MSHISTAVEYGLHCLLYLSEPAAGVHEASSKDLAELQGVPVEYLAKLFTKLSKAGIVVATEGVRGGFKLARPAAQISVLDVVRAIDGNKAVRLPRDSWQLRRVWRQTAGVGNPRRLFDSRSHAGCGKAHD
jgi:Rrf2 family protein